MNYENFRLDCNNMYKLAPKLISELEGKEGKIKVITYKLSGQEVSYETEVEQVKKVLEDKKLNDVAILNMKMRFEEI